MIDSPKRPTGHGFAVRGRLDFVICCAPPREGPGDQEKELFMGRRLYVGNIPYSAGEDELRELFGRFGTVESISIPTDMATGRPRGFAFVELSSDEEAAAAIGELNQVDFQGRRLTVNEARPKAARPAPDPGFDGGRREPRW